MGDTEALDDVDTLLSILGELTSEQEMDSDTDSDEDDDDDDDDEDDDDDDDDDSNDEGDGEITILDRCLGRGERGVVDTRGGESVNLVGYTFFTAMRIFQDFLRSKVKDFVAGGREESRRYVTIVTGSEFGPGHGPAVRNNVRYFLASNGYSLTCREGQDFIVVDLENSVIN